MERTETELPRPSFSADWGDYHSFAHHLRAKADAEGVDLLLIDTGDRIEGNGLYDGSRPKGDLYFDILTKQNIDLICSGNHELYLQNSSEAEFYNTVPAYKDNYLASNLDIHNPETGEWQALAPRYKKFTTKNQGIRILAFGFLFDFDRNANNTRVQPVEETVKEKWFQKSIRDKDIDLIVVFGHVALRTKEFDIIFKAIRDAQWDRPIAFFGGHAHVRDFKVFDKKAMALASGRYMETIGFMGMSGVKAGGKSASAEPDDVDALASVKFDRRYIDKNLYSFYQHSGTNQSTFPTELGENITTTIKDARKQLKLDHRRGCAPQNYWVNRAPYPSPDSIFTLLVDHIMPDQLAKSERIVKEGRKALAMTNTGSIRFDIFKGPFTKDTEFLISPFLSGFKYVPDVSFKVAAQVLQMINNEGPVLMDTRGAGLQSWRLPPIEQSSRRLMMQQTSLHERSAFSHGNAQQIPMQSYLKGNSSDEQVFPGYTTIDDLGKEGDDTIHSQISFHDVPNAIQAPIGFSIGPEFADDQPTMVDLVYNEFMQPWILLALEYLGDKRTANDTGYYAEGKTVTVLIREWVQANWAVEEGKDCP